MVIKICVVCGKEFEGQGSQKTCCSEHSNLLKHKEKICQCCGQIFNAKNKNGKFSKKRKYCSKKCADIINQLQKNKRRRERYKDNENYRHKIKKNLGEYNRSEHGKQILQANKLSRDKRIKDNGKIDKDINLLSLFERDGGICWLCGEFCLIEDKECRVSEKGNVYIATFGNYPSIDHVIPLAKGGSHTWKNVRLAHKKCNSLKRDKIITEELETMH